MNNRTELITQLARVFPEEAAARGLLEDIGFPRDCWPTWSSFGNPRAYWTQVLTEIENGRIDGEGPEGLAQAAHRQFPGNAVFRETAGHEAKPPDEQPPDGKRLDETTVEDVTPRAGATAPPRPAERDRAEQKVWPTLIFQRSEQYDEFVRLVRGIVGPEAELLYATGEEAAVQVPDGLDEENLLEQVRRDLRALNLDEAEVRFERYTYAPHLLQWVRLVGPDQEMFYAHNVPNTTPVRDLPSALLANYGEQTQQDRLGRTRRTVVDQVVPGEAGAPSTQRRLEPNQTLHEAGVQEGDELHVRPESTAGAISQRLRRSALAVARNEIREYEETHPDFEILDTDHELLPTRYEFKFDAPGFGPPDELDGPPPELRPVPRDQHQAQIILADLFPLRAPYILFSTPIFHPNVEPGRAGARPKGLACLGVLGENAYRGDLDFHELCALIKDMAAYRNYGALPLGMLDSGGFFDPIAAEWACSDAGQEMIVARGGVALLPMVGLEEAPPPKRLRISRADAGDRP